MPGEGTQTFVKGCAVSTTLRPKQLLAGSLITVNFSLLPVSLNLYLPVLGQLMPPVCWSLNVIFDPEILYVPLSTIVVPFW